MKIVHFGKYYYPDLGGIESTTLTFANARVALGDTVAVVCFAQRSPPGTTEIDGVRVIRAPRTLMIASQPLSLGYFWHCLREGRRADLVHLHMPNMLAAVCGLLLTKRTRLLVHWHSDVINKGVFGLLARPLERALLTRANGISVATRAYAEASRTLTPFLRKVSVVAHGVADPARLTADEIGAALPSQLQQAIRGRRVILAVGRLVPYKGFEVLVAATRYLAKDAVVVIVGDGPLEKSLAHQIAARPGPAGVVLTGRLPHRALMALFETAALFCLPSLDRAEAYGLVLTEAMAYGLPIVASDIPGSGSPWVNQHGTSGVNVPVGDSRALAQACNDILNSEATRERYAVGARARFLAELTEKRSVERMMNLYSQLVRG